MSIFGKLFGRKLTQAERWAIATGANVAATQGDPFSRLAMDFLREVARQSLRDWWAVDGEVEVEERVVRLALQGHNAGFRELHRRVSRMDREEVEAWARELPDEEEARRIQSIYGFWQELSDNYLYARRWWGGEEEGEQVFADTAWRLLNHPDSPWHDLPWQTPLS